MNAVRYSKHAALSLLGAVLLLGSTALRAEVQVSLAAPANPKPATQELLSTDNYLIRTAPIAPLRIPPPELPDTSGFTKEAALERLDKRRNELNKGRVNLHRMLRQDTLREFTGGDERLRVWLGMQRGMPQAIFIEGGYMTPKRMAAMLPKKYFEETEPGIFVARLPVVVANDSLLYLDASVKDFRMSQERGSFLVNDGNLFIIDSRLTAWSETANEPAWFKKEGAFRPFLNSWGGTDTYIINSTVTSLGYADSKSYGVSISQYSPAMVDKMGRPHPTAWLINSMFDDMWYGFYCYEADDVVLLGNTYKNNIVYGIDPHDRSRRLIIADNTAYGTKQKHGIIISREVNDSWIFNNRSYDNELSGIVIDRSSINNVIAYNESWNNKSDGITIYESGNNMLWGNKVVGNDRHGIRVRNSVDIKLYENFVSGNGKLGVYGHIKDLTDTDRDIDLDPFDTQVSLLVVGGQLAGNLSGPIGVDSPLSIELYNVEMLAPAKASGITLPGILGKHQDQILDLMVRKQQAVLIDPVETQKELLDGIPN
jgi:poly(beta-D-mannuronate) C5 epimerase